MTKKRSIVKLCIIAVLTLIGLFLTFFSFIIPTTTTTFNGFFKAINFGYDVNGGYVAIYKSADSNMKGYELQKNVEGTVSRINKFLGGFGFSATKQNDNIRVEISKTKYDEVYAKYNVDVLNLIGSEKGINFSDDSSNENAEGFVSGEHISNVTYKYAAQINSNGESGYVINIEFDEEGKTLFKALTKKIADTEGTSKLYMFMNGSDATNGGYEINTSVESLTLTTPSEASARSMSLQILSLAKPMLLTSISGGEVTAGLNSSTGFFFGNQKNLMLFGIAVLFVASVIALCIRYRLFGAMASASILIFTIIYSFLLQSIPLVTLNFSGAMGVLVTYALLLAGFVSVFERIKKEYNIGKKIPNAVTSGFRKVILPMLEKYCILLVFSVIFYLVGVPMLKYFAASLFIGLLVNFFTIFVVTRGLCKIYLSINSTNKKLYNLKREATKDEV